MSLKNRVCFIVGFAQCTAMFSTSNISSVIVVKVVPLTYHHQKCLYSKPILVYGMPDTYRNNERYFCVSVVYTLSMCLYCMSSCMIPQQLQLFPVILIVVFVINFVLDEL